MKLILGQGGVNMRDPKDIFPDSDPDMKDLAPLEVDPFPEDEILLDDNGGDDSAKAD
jgi:hypothetical protein